MGKYNPARMLPGPLIHAGIEADFRNLPIPKQMLLKSREGPRSHVGGFVFGSPAQSAGSLVGLPPRAEGNIMVTGGNGSGKTSGTGKASLACLSGSACVTDIKGELSLWYKKLFEEGIVTRPYIIFEPTDPESVGYDISDAIGQGVENGEMDNLDDLGFSLLPDIPNDHQPFWRKMERNYLMAAFLYYLPFKLGFSATLLEILSRPASSLCKEMLKRDDLRIKILLGEIASTKPETLANIDAGLRSELAPLANDVCIAHAFRGPEEGAKCFRWKDLEDHVIFLRIPESKIDAWGGAINVMYSQLIRYLERRPDRHSHEGKEMTQILLLMDEFARFGKLERLPSAMATLRSKGVNVCLMAQSIAQLDKIYGVENRKIIFDNCQYQVILRANDADTQNYLSGLIGSHTVMQRTVSRRFDKGGKKILEYSEQLSESRQPILQPHELATLQDVALLSPYGFHLIKKIPPTGDFSWLTPPHPSQELQIAKAVTCAANKTYIPLRNKGARMMTIDQRMQNAENHVRATKQAERVALGEQKRLDSRRNYYMGGLITMYFPEVRSVEPGTTAENVERFSRFEAILSVLSVDYELMEDLEKRADALIASAPQGTWQMSRPRGADTPQSDNVHLHIEDSSERERGDER